jgi:hypothetical protein
MDAPDLPDGPTANPALIVAGVVIAVTGMLMLVDRLLDREYSLAGSWWPLILIVMGAARLATPKPVRAGKPACGYSRSGMWLILVGLWGLASEAHLFGLTYNTSWPLLIIASGAMIVWRAFDPRPARPVREER